MNKKSLAFSVLLVFAFSAVATLRQAGGLVVFKEDFSSGELANWSQIVVGPGSNQTVSNSVAHFTVPTPVVAGNCTYSYLIKDGFTSTPNSVITASQDIYLTKVPSGCPEGNTAIFFFYICDSTDLGGNQGNVGVGIDASNVWCLWIGGNTTYTYVVQRIGSAPTSNTWYHIALIVDNPSATVALLVNGAVVINASQQQFTDKMHTFSLMTGMGEVWWWQTSGQQEIDVANVKVDISDATSPLPTYTPVPPLPTSTPTWTTQTATPTGVPSTTPKPSASPSLQPQPTQNYIEPPQNRSSLPLTLRGSIANPEISNLTLSVNPMQEKTTVSFLLTGQTAGLGNISVPRSAVQSGASPTIYATDQLCQNQGYTQDDSNFYVWCMLPSGTTEVSIVFATDSAPAASPLGLMVAASLLAVFCIAVAFILKKYR